MKLTHRGPFMFLQPYINSTVDGKHAGPWPAAQNSTDVWPLSLRLCSNKTQKSRSRSQDFFEVGFRIDETSAVSNY